MIEAVAIFSPSEVVASSNSQNEWTEMIVSLAYDQEKNRIFGFCRTDPPYQGDVRFFINAGEEAFGLSFEKLATLAHVVVDKDGMAVSMEERPPFISPETNEIPKWLKRPNMKNAGIASGVE